MLQVRLLKKCLNQLKTSNEQTQICKLCFAPIQIDSFGILLNKHETLCRKCRESFEPIFKNFKVDGINALAIYEYDGIIKEYLYQLKGCFDIEIANIFLSPFFNELKLKYNGYYVVPAPSYYKNDEMREFNHVEEIFKLLKLPVLKIITKTNKFKQAEHNSLVRKQIRDYLKLNDTTSLKGKKILLVDDVFTTGSTMKACIKLIKTLNPKKIEVLVMSKTNDISP